jgi:hypothetical protein
MLDFNGNRFVGVFKHGEQEYEGFLWNQLPAVELW